MPPAYDGHVSVFGPLATQRTSAVDWLKAANTEPTFASVAMTAAFAERKAVATAVKRQFDYMTASSADSKKPATLSRHGFVTLLFHCDLVNHRHFAPSSAASGRPSGSSSHRITVRPPAFVGVVDRFEDVPLPSSANFTSQATFDMDEGTGPLLPFDSAIQLDVEDAQNVYDFCRLGLPHGLNFESFVVAIAHIGFKLSSRGSTSFATLLRSWSVYVATPFLEVHATSYPFPQTHYESCFDTARVFAKYSTPLYRIFTANAQESSAASSGWVMPHSKFRALCAELGLEGTVPTDTLDSIFDTTSVSSRKAEAALLADVSLQSARQPNAAQRVMKKTVDAWRERGGAPIESKYLTFDEWLDALARLGCEATSGAAFSDVASLAQRVEHVISSLFGPLYHASFDRDLAQDVSSQTAADSTFGSARVVSCSPAIINAKGDVLTVTGSGLGAYGRGVWVYASCAPAAMHFGAEALLPAGDGAPDEWARLSVPVAAVGSHVQWSACSIDLTAVDGSVNFPEWVMSQTANSAVVGSNESGDDRVALSVHCTLSTPLDLAIANCPDDLLLRAEPICAGSIALALDPMTISARTVKLLEAAFLQGARKSSSFNRHSLYAVGFRHLWNTFPFQLGPNNRFALGLQPAGATASAKTAYSREGALMHLFDTYARVTGRETAAQPSLNFAAFVEVMTRLTLSFDGSTEQFDERLAAQVTVDGGIALEGGDPNEVSMLNATTASAMESTIRGAASTLRSGNAGSATFGTSGALANSTLRSEVLLKSAANQRKQNDALYTHLQNLRVRLEEAEKGQKKARAAALRVAEAFEGLAAVADMAVVHLSKASKIFATTAAAAASPTKSSGQGSPHRKPAVFALPRDTLLAVTESMKQAVERACYQGRVIAKAAVPELGTEEAANELRNLKLSDSMMNTEANPSLSSMLSNPVVDVSLLRAEVTGILLEADSKLKEYVKKQEQDRAATNVAKAIEMTQQAMAFATNERGMQAKIAALEEELESAKESAANIQSMHAAEAQAAANEIQKSHTEASNLRQQLEQAKTNLKQAQTRIAALEKTLHARQQLTVPPDTTIRSKSPSSTDSSPNLTNAADAISAASQTRKAEEELKSLRAHNERLLTQNASLDGESKFVKASLDEARQKRKEAENKCAVLQKRVETLEDQLARRGVEIDEARFAANLALVEAPVASGTFTRRPSLTFHQSVDAVARTQRANSIAARRASRFFVDTGMQTDVDPTLFTSILNEYDPVLPPATMKEWAANPRIKIRVARIGSNLRDLRDSLAALRAVVKRGSLSLVTDFHSVSEKVVALGESAAESRPTPRRRQSRVSPRRTKSQGGQSSDDENNKASSKQRSPNNRRRMSTNVVMVGETVKDGSADDSDGKTSPRRRASAAVKSPTERVNAAFGFDDASQGHRPSRVHDAKSPHRARHSITVTTFSGAEDRGAHLSAGHTTRKVSLSAPLQVQRTLRDDPDLDHMMVIGQKPTALQSPSAASATSGDATTEVPILPALPDVVRNYRFGDDVVVTPRNDLSSLENSGEGDWTAATSSVPSVPVVVENPHYRVIIAPRASRQLSASPLNEAQRDAPLLAVSQLIAPSVERSVRRHNAADVKDTTPPDSLLRSYVVARGWDGQGALTSAGAMELVVYGNDSKSPSQEDDEVNWSSAQQQQLLAQSTNQRALQSQLAAIASLPTRPPVATIPDGRVEADLRRQAIQDAEIAALRKPEARPSRPPSGAPAVEHPAPTPVTVPMPFALSTTNKVPKPISFKPDPKDAPPSDAPVFESVMNAVFEGRQGSERSPRTGRPLTSAAGAGKPPASMLPHAPREPKSGPSSWAAPPSRLHLVRPEHVNPRPPVTHAAQSVTIPAVLRKAQSPRS